MAVNNCSPIACGDNVGHGCFVVWGRERATNASVNRFSPRGRLYSRIDVMGRDFDVYAHEDG